MKIHTLIITKARRIKSDIPENSILLDIDKPKFSLSKIFIILRLVRITPTFIRCDRTRHGWHVVIVVSNGTKLSSIEKIALQAMLGSDTKREALNFFRYRNGVSLNLLFEHKKELTQ